ncbi:hypothetical protein AVEN_68301-1 [Araneus ventricosus]|uniref:Integrase catalytic domain-containing protein n=1 Tax=Araneus ventricosus TaxID=182803 RepID=A0A4Y2HLD2_ARAVE|nr:hypothetical protein AVEN_68301-1 [Araneus ventricosus]
METVWRGLTSEACLVYLDDIIRVGRTFEEYLNNIRKVFQRLRKANLKLSPKKCKFFRKEVSDLEHIISVDGVKTVPEETKIREPRLRLKNLFEPGFRGYGVPMILHSDQDTNFKYALFTDLCKLLGILKTRTTALQPESDGIFERFNRTILNHLSLFVSKNQTDWDTHLPLFLLAYRSADHEVTGFTPADMFFGRTLLLPCDILFGKPSDTPSSSNEYLNNSEPGL